MLQGKLGQLHIFKTKKTMETQLFFINWCCFLSLELLFHDKETQQATLAPYQWLALNGLLQSADTTKLNLSV